LRGDGGGEGEKRIVLLFSFFVPGGTVWREVHGPLTDPFPKGARELFLQLYHVLGPQALVAVGHVEADGLAFVQSLEPVASDGGVVRVTKPKPLDSLNHFTVPFAIVISSFLSLQSQEGCHKKTRKAEYFAGHIRQNTPYCFCRSMTRMRRE
jgi:hypothetical protein